MIPVPVKALSPSGLTRWRQCRRSWRHRYVDHFPDQSGAAAIAGTFIHRTLEMLYQEPPGARTVDRARALAREAWEETARREDYLALGLGPRGIWDLKDRSWKITQRLWELEAPEVVEVRATERRVKVELAGVPFQGVVDRVDRDGKVVDYKSGKIPRYPNYVQLLLYAAAVREQDGGPLPREVDFYYLKPGKALGITVDEETVAEAVDGMARSWEAIGRACDEEHFPAATSDLCGWCPYVSFCAEGTRFLEAKAARKAAR